MPVNRFLLLILIALVAESACAKVQEEACFTSLDNKRLSFQVIQQTPPPTVDATYYPYYPLTAAASMQLGSLALGQPGVDTWYFQWANRSNAPLYNARGKLVPRKANFQPHIGASRVQRTAFSSLAKADACTLAQTASILQRPAMAAKIARSAKVTLVSESHQADGAGQGPNDTCVLADGTLPKASKGILLDFEPQDGRSASQTLAFMKQFTKMVRSAGRKSMLLLDPFDAPTQIYTGISASNANSIVAMFDLTAIMLWSRSKQKSLQASYEAQMAMIRSGGPVDGQRLLINFDLAGTSEADARFVRKVILEDKLAGVMFWRNWAKQGGSCETDVNRKIASIVFEAHASTLSH